MTTISQPTHTPQRPCLACGRLTAHRLPCCGVFCCVTRGCAAYHYHNQQRGAK